MSLQDQGTAAITGASTGIGAVYADRLARRGFDLLLNARNRQRLDTLAAKLRAETGRKVTVLAADLATVAGQSAVETALRADPNISMLVNNAGVGAVAPLLAADADKMTDMIALNVTALTRLTYAAAPAFAARGNGTIVNVSSIVAVHPELLNGVYGATKAFVLALTQSLHHELAAKGVRVQAVLPGAIATEFWDIAGNPVRNIPAEIVMTAEDLVDSALAGLDAGELVTLPSLPEIADWVAFEIARRAMMPNLSRNRPAQRYLSGRAVTRRAS